MIKLLKFIAGLSFWACIVGFAIYAIHHDNMQDQVRASETTKQWNEWAVWRDANCHVSERMVGLSETSGKFHQYDNATVYDCGGMKYVVADSVEDAAKNQSLEYSQIPKLFNKK